MAASSRSTRSKWRIPTSTFPTRRSRSYFDFFDQYDWHLDTRPLQDDNEINPDVLGYIFEKYINQKQMGAYYTKEDITDTSARTRSFPICSMQRKRNARSRSSRVRRLWRLLQDDPERYIYPAVRKGVIDEQGEVIPLPADIAAGVDDVGRRDGWNRAADPEFALPTETWREHVARRRRCLELREKLQAGEVHEVNDLITYNLDIRQFAEDVIAGCEGPELLRAFWQAIRSVTVLDPTCGSGAFLFAALNILQPLYEACLDRMQAFIQDLECSSASHSPKKFDDFRRILAEIDRHPNRNYFILKSIIVGNLYGVDIMEEAVEICKLRLFLKLVAQVDRVDDLEPLPDIDFNIRPGNTLIGFARFDDVKTTILGRLADAALKADVDRIVEEAEVVDRAFRKFHEMQTEYGMDAREFAAQKQDLRQRLGTLADQLDHYLAGEYGIDPEKPKEFEKWRSSHQPFHWFAEFYGIMDSGGFNAIIGNPPYVEIPKELSRSLLRKQFCTALERWSRDEDVYTLVVERSLNLLESGNGYFGMILPVSLTFSTKAPFERLRKMIAAEHGSWWMSHFDRIPSALFGNDVRIRCTIALFGRIARLRSTQLHTTSLLRWPTEFREFLFSQIHYADIDVPIANGIPKVASQLQADTLHSLLAMDTTLGQDLTRSISFTALADSAPNFPAPCVFVGGTAYNWFPAWREIPETIKLDGSSSLPARTAGYLFRSNQDADIVFALLCSSLGYWWWAVASDGFNLKKWLVQRFPIAIESLNDAGKNELAKLGLALGRSSGGTTSTRTIRGESETFSFRRVGSKCKQLTTHLPGTSKGFHENSLTISGHLMHPFHERMPLMRAKNECSFRSHASITRRPRSGSGKSAGALG